MRRIVFVATLCLLLTARVDGMSNKKKRRKKSNDSVFERKRACQTGACGHLVPLESMNCVNECVSPDCYRKTYAEPLEDGEVNKQLSTNFLACARKEMNASKNSQKRSERQAASTSRKSAAAAAATGAASTVDSDEPVAVPEDSGAAAEQKELTAVGSEDYEMTDGDAEEGEWDDGFEESSDEGVVGPEVEEQREAEQTVAALR